jgi:plasmid stabilization system protein ParE
MGHVREDIAEKVRSFPVGSHIAYYRKNGIAVLRVLHPRIDVERPFASPNDTP